MTQFLAAASSGSVVADPFLKVDSAVGVVNTSVDRGEGGVAS